LAAAAFLQLAMNFLRSLPWTPFASASFEHSSEAAVRGFCAFFSAVVAFAAGAGAAGAAVCADAELISNSDAKAIAAAREIIVFMGHLMIEERQRRPGMLNQA